MSELLSREQIEDLLNYLGSAEIKTGTGDNVQACCPVHQESTPSMGVSISKGIYNCFACHSSGTLGWLVFQSMPDDFKSLRQAEEFIAERYGVDISKSTRDWGVKLKRYGEELIEESKRFELPKYKLAPFKSGKETYKYFFSRGFTKETMQKFMIGRDLTSKTVTIPVFWEDNVLAGVIGRYIDPNRPKNSRYKVYDFPKSSLTFPLDKLEVVDDTIILVEGILDAVWLHQLGFTNAQAILGNGLSKDQASIIKKRASNVIDMFDNDTGGIKAREIAKERLGKDVMYFSVTYPEGKYDPQECSKEEIQQMLDNKESTLRKKLRRI